MHGPMNVKRKKVTGSVHEGMRTFMIISCQIVLRKKNHLNAVLKIKTHILCSITYLSPPSIPENCAVYEIMEEYGRAQQATDDNIMWHMRFACWITKATNTPSEYAIHIAFPWQQWLSEHVWMLRYTYIACLV